MKSDALHIANKSHSKKTAEIAQIRKIAEAAQLVAEENSTKNGKFKHFYYYEAAVRYRGETFNVYLNVGVARNDATNHIYDITQKLRDTAQPVAVGRLSKSFALRSGISDKSIYKASENVNIKENTADETDLMKKDQRRQNAATRRGASKDSVRSSEENVKKFSMEAPVEDSNGRRLTNAQREFFRDSKAIDSEGRLLTLYHGTGAKFTVFDKAHIGENFGNRGGDLGFYFSPYIEDAKGEAEQPFHDSGYVYRSCSQVHQSEETDAQDAERTD